jgi:hypothetical protein
MRTDDDIKRDVENELKWDPDIDSSDIGIAVKGWRGHIVRFRAQLPAKAQGRRGRDACARREGGRK